MRRGAGRVEVTTGLSRSRECGGTPVGHLWPASFAKSRGCGRLTRPFVAVWLPYGSLVWLEGLPQRVVELAGGPTRLGEGPRSLVPPADGPKMIPCQRVGETRFLVAVRGRRQRSVAAGSDPSSVCGRCPWRTLPLFLGLGAACRRPTCPRPFWSLIGMFPFCQNGDQGQPSRFLELRRSMGAPSRGSGPLGFSKGRVAERSLRLR